MVRQWLLSGLALLSVQVLLVSCGAPQASTPSVLGTDVALSAAPSQSGAAPQENSLGPLVLTWEGRLDGECHAMSLDAEGHASFGPCSGTRSVGVILPEMERSQDLLYFLDDYQPFEADTSAGRLTLAGRGAQAAAPAESRALAEWASIVYREVQFGRSGASWGLAVALNQEGANPCSRLQIELYGKVFANDCSTGIEPLPVAWLALDQLERLYTWIDELQAFEMSWSEDGLPVQLVFTGRGNQSASESDRLEIRSWVSGLHQSRIAN